MIKSHLSCDICEASIPVDGGTPLGASVGVFTLGGMVKPPQGWATYTEGERSTQHICPDCWGKAKSAWAVKIFGQICPNGVGVDGVNTGENK